MQTRKDEAIPAFLREIPMDPTSTLEYIKAQISSIYTAAKTSNINDETALHIDHDTYAKIYTAVFDYTRVSDNGPKTQQSPAARGEIIFQHLSAEIKAYCQYIRGQILSVDNNEVVHEISARKVLKMYMSCYGRFSKLSVLVKNLLGFWNRHWVRRQWDNKKIKARSVEELHKMTWEEEVLEQKGLEEVTDAVAVLRELDGGMSDYDSALVKDVVKSLSGLGVTLES